MRESEYCYNSVIKANIFEPEQLSGKYCISQPER